jgi:cell division protein FtsZ
VIAAGFDGGMPKRRDQSQPALRREPATQPTTPASAVHPDAETVKPAPAVPQQPVAPQPAQKSEPPAKAPRAIPFDDGDDLDVPDFLK